MTPSTPSAPGQAATLLCVRQAQPVGALVDRYITRALLRRAAVHAAQRGHKMAIFANDLIGIDINQHGVYERDELALLFAFLQPLAATFAAGVALDVGANIGNHSLFFARRFAAVHAFEPHPDTFALLRFNTQWDPRIHARRVGLGSEAGRFELFEHATNLGGSSLRNASAQGDRKVSIDIERLDDLALDGRGPDFMKIDVEGFETEVLKGGLNTIARGQPLIVLEQHLAEFRDGQPEAVRLLAGLGYRFAWHAAPPLPRTWLGRRWADLRDLWRGQTHRIVTASEVQARHHSMLVAVPPRFQHALGLPPGA